MNFQIFKLDLEKAEEPEIRLPKSVGSWKKQESSIKTSTYALLTMSKHLTVWITTNWKILKEMGIPDHLTCLLRNLYAGQEARVRTGCRTTDWFQIGKGVRQGYMEKAMATHFSTLAWRILWMEEPGGLQSMGSLSRTRLSDFLFTFHFHALEKEMATHSSVLAWRIPGMGEPGGLLSMGSHRVGHKSK